MTHRCEPQKAMWAALVLLVLVSTGSLALDNPTKLTVTPETDGAMTLKWKDESSSETAFEIERSEDGKTFALYATVPRNTTTFRDTNTQWKRKYYYRVRAVRDATTPS